ncbi:MAG: phosphate/phosphite/phosphonate ABC transporter substrate-binding protein [Bacillota bacterium]
MRAQSRKHPVALLILPLVLAALLTGCRSSYPQLNLRPPEGVDAVSVPTPQLRVPTSRRFGPEVPYVRLAIAPVMSPSQTRQDFRRLLAYLPGQLDHPVELVLRPTYAEISHLIAQRLVDVALVGNWSYVDIEGSHEVELLAVPQVDGQIEHRSYIIVSAKSSIFGLEDLRDERFLFTDPLSFSGRLYVLYRLAELGETEETFFSRSLYSYNHHSSIMAVAEGWVTAAAVESSVYRRLIHESPGLEEKIRIIEVSPLVGNSPVIACTKLPQELRDRLRDVLLHMHEDPEGQKALAEMRIERFMPVGDELYDPVRQMRKTIMGTTR